MDAEVNEPLALPMRGASGKRTKEQMKQRAAMKQLLINGLTDDELCAAMDAEFGLTVDESLELKERVQEILIRESDARKPAKKAMTEQRIHRHIMSAAKKNQFGAVAALEATLAKVQGTEEPLVQQVHIDQRVTQATMTVLGNLSSAQMEELIQSELAASARTLPAGAELALPRVVQPRVAR